MKRCLCIFSLLLLCLTLSAQTASVVRVGQNIRFFGSAVSSTSGHNWLVWDESVGSAYQMKVQKYDSSGTAMFAAALTIPGGSGSHKVYEIQATSDGGLAVMYMADNLYPDGVLSFKLQKINSAAVAQWGPSGIWLSDDQPFKYLEAKISANNLGGVFLVYRDHPTGSDIDFKCKNFDAGGTNVWTEADSIQYDSASGIRQLLLTDSGDLIISLESLNGLYLRKVNNSGATVGNFPMFPAGAVLPQAPMLIKASDGTFLMHTSQVSSDQTLSMQKMDANGNLLYSSLKYIQVSGLESPRYGIKFAAISNGGFVLSYLRGPSQGHGLKYIQAQSLNSELEPLWGDQGQQVYSTTDDNVLRYMDMKADAAGNTWITAVQGNVNYTDMQVKAIKLNADGTIAFPMQNLSVDTLIKEYATLCLQGDGAVIFWTDRNGDQLSLMRQLLSSGGEQMLEADGETLKSVLAGAPSVLGAYSLGDRSVVLMLDSRFSDYRLYYQLLDSQGIPLLSANGLPLDSAEGNFWGMASAKVSPQNTLVVCYKKLAANGAATIYLQEIDAQGNLLYSQDGVAITEIDFSLNFALAIEGNARYAYWEDAPSVPRRYRILGQKLIGGVKQWSPGTVVVDVEGRSSYPMDAHGRFLLFKSRVAGETVQDLRCLLIDGSGAPASGWNADGELLIGNSEEYLDALVSASGLIDDELYSVIYTYTINGNKLVLQKTGAANPRMWGENGIPLAMNDIGWIQPGNAIFEDQLTLLFMDSVEGFFMQKIDAQGNFLIPGNGFMVMPIYYDMSEPRLLQYDNGAYSCFWTQESRLKYIYIDTAFNTTEHQPITHSNVFDIRSTLCGDQALLLWSRETGDAFDYDHTFNSSVYAASFDEPVSTNDPQSPELLPLLVKQNYPNPFKTVTTIVYTLGQKGRVDIEIYNLKGQKVRSEYRLSEPGEGSWSWDGRDSKGNKCASGLYLYKVQSGNTRSTNKMILMQ